MERPIVKKVLILGGGSAGLLTALGIKAKLPGMPVTVLRSTALGVIGVGEGTTQLVPNFLHGKLGIPPGDFLRQAKPTYKLGLKFLWGPRPSFNYTFDVQLNGQYSRMSKENGFYCDDNIDYISPTSSMMTHDRVFARRPDGLPLLLNNHAYHIENAHLVEFLEARAAQLGVIMDDDTVESVEQDDSGIKALLCTSGRKFESDLFVDCSGFASLLLGKTLKEPFVSFKSSLFCDRAVVGGWERSADEVIKPYTTCETMNSGWCWRIDHETRINRGYVYSSGFISDEQAELEFRTKNPKVRNTRIVQFITGAYQRAWVKNVVAVGNSLGFVEPLEATAIEGICQQVDSLSQALVECRGELNPGLAYVHNKAIGIIWQAIRNFLAVHYKFNTRLDTEFWKAARSDVEIGGAAEYVDFYTECGPGKFWMKVLLEDKSISGPEGYLTMMVGMKVPYKNRFEVSPQERLMWDNTRQINQKAAMNCMGMPEALGILRQGAFPWDPHLYSAMM